MELIIADRVGKTVERYRVVYCSQEMDDVMHFVAFPDGYILPISRHPTDIRNPLCATILASNLETLEMKRFNVAHYKLVN